MLSISSSSQNRRRAALSGARPDDERFGVQYSDGETEMCVEQPTLFGLHNNAEIGYLTSVCNNLFTTIMSMSGGGGGDGGGGTDKVKRLLHTDRKSVV